MNIKDVRIGMKVVPTKKTVPDFGDLKKSAEWNRAQTLHSPNPFLYVVQNLDKKRYDYEGDLPDHVILLNAKRKGEGGDYFFPEDFKPYEQPTK